MTLAIMAGVGALAWPALRSSLDKNSLRTAARQVHTELQKTRNRAIRTGQPHQFRYQPGSPQFEVAPFPACPVERPAAARSERDDDEAEAATPAAEVLQLPDGVHFGDQLVDDAAPDDADENLLAMADEEGWSRPIVFLPDGKSSDARIALEDESRRRMDVVLRGLTGSAHTTDPTPGAPRP